MSTEKVQGTVKWFSNKKGYGFITPVEGSTTTEDIFVHQSVIHSEGYRTLDEGWIVEFEIGHDEDGKIKAENVTAPGGGPCTGPRSSHRRRERRNGDGTKDKPRDDSKNDKSQIEKAAQSFWHDSLSEDVKSVLNAKSIRTNTGTIDVAFGHARIKLGTRGYSSMAHGDKILAEGTFECGDDGVATFTWKHALKFDEEWKPLEDTTALVSQLSLSSVDVVAVGPDETAETLMGESFTDPRSALESNGFEMRRIVLTTKKRRR